MPATEREVQKIGAMMTVSQQLLDDAQFDLKSFVAQSLARQLERFAFENQLRVRIETISIEAADGGHWVEGDRPWWKRLLRISVPDVWVPMVMYRAHALADPVFTEGDANA